MSQIGANNRTAGQVQSEVEFAPAAAYSLDFMLLGEPFPLAEDLEAGTVHHQMDSHRPGLPHRLSDAQAVCATRQCGVIRHPYIQPHERADGAHKSLRLPQRKPIRHVNEPAADLHKPDLNGVLTDTRGRSTRRRRRVWKPSYIWCSILSYSANDQAHASDKTPQE